MPDPVAEDVRIQIGGVETIGDVFFRKKPEQLVLRNVEQGADESSIPWTHRCQSFGTASAQNSDENGFSLVVLCVRDRDIVESLSPSSVFEKTIPDGTKLFLIHRFRPTWVVREKGDAIKGTQFSDQRLVRIRFDSPDTVIDVRDSQAEVEL